MIDYNLYIQDYCHIKNGELFINGISVFKDKRADTTSFLKSAYKKFCEPYPKFYKMDTLSKLGFIAADLLLKDKGIDDSTAMIFTNKSASLDTDIKHQTTIENLNNYYPSPSIFVYTLPNICMGEISIKHKLHSENSFFIFEAFNAEHLYNYCEALINNDRAKNCLCAWLEVDEGEYEGFMYFVGKEGSLVHSANELFRLYRLHD